MHYLVDIDIEEIGKFKIQVYYKSTDLELVKHIQDWVQGWVHGIDLFIFTDNNNTTFRKIINCFSDEQLELIDLKKYLDLFHSLEFDSYTVKLPELYILLENRSDWCRRHHINDPKGMAEFMELIKPIALK